MKYISIIFIFFILFSCKENSDIKNPSDSNDPRPKQENQDSDTKEPEKDQETSKETANLPAPTGTTTIEQPASPPESSPIVPEEQKILEMLSGTYIGEVDVDYSWFSNITFVEDASVHINVNYSNINNDRKIIIFVQSDDTEESLCSIISDLQFDKDAQTISGKIQSRGQIKDARTVSGNIEWLTLIYGSTYEIQYQLYIGESTEDKEQVVNLRKVNLPNPSFENLNENCNALSVENEILVNDLNFSTQPFHLLIQGLSIFPINYRQKERIIKKS